MIEFYKKFRDIFEFQIAFGVNPSEEIIKQRVEELFNKELAFIEKSIDKLKESNIPGDTVS